MMPASTDVSDRRHWRFATAVTAAAIFAMLFAQFAPRSGAAVQVRDPFTGQGLDDVDARPGWISPSPEQLEAVRRLGAAAQWTQFGTVSSLIRYRGSLGKATSNDPVAAARRWVLAHRELFRLSRSAVAHLALVADAPTEGGVSHAVLLEQRFGTLPSGYDGMITVAVARGQIWYVSSSASGDARAAAPAVLTPVQAWLRAARAVGERVRAGELSLRGSAKGWLTFDLPAFRFRQYVRPVALPIPGRGVVPAYETIVVHNGPSLAAYTQFVDARTGKIWVRENNVDQESDTPAPPRAADSISANLSAALINLPEPTWQFFGASPPLDYRTRDTRILACWNRQKVRGCGLEVANPAARAPWDENVRLDLPWFTTMGNAAWAAQAWLNPEAPGEGYRPLSLDRSYDFSWTNQWRSTRCNPAALLSAQRADVDASIANLFAFHNRMHDWAYHLGFTERTWNLQDDNFGNTTPGPFPVGGELDMELGDVQAGALDGGPTAAGLGRDNANQTTLPDGIPGITNQYLFQPLPGSFYTPCVDGDFDLGVVGHEYTHAISNRMAGGPIRGLGGLQAGSMGESWSDQDALEFMQEHGYLPVADENPWAEGPYVTGNKTVGIRNYALNDNPLNYSDMGYNTTGPEVHADGEIWSAVGYDIRERLVKKYNARYPERDRKLQLECADGLVAADRCPGNRRWIQIVFDAWLFMPHNVDMLGARDAYLAADKMRFGGANQADLWNVFAHRGFGQYASSRGGNDDQPVPDFRSPLAKDEASVSFEAIPGARSDVVLPAEVYVGDYTARVTPIADTETKTARRSSAAFVPGRYHFIFRGDGYGAQGFDVVLHAGQRLTVRAVLPRNLASVSSGATGSGDGTKAHWLMDDNEGTSWSASGPVKGRQVTIHLAGRSKVRTVAVSALINPSGPGGRFSALRQFAIYACDDRAPRTDCSRAGAFRKIYTSPAAAFPTELPRPVAPNLLLRTFNVPDTWATDVRLVVLTNQCTGNRLYRGEQDADPLNDTDCVSGSDEDNVVRVAEIQVFDATPRLLID